MLIIALSVLLFFSFIYPAFSFSPKTNDHLTPVSRAEVAEVCVSALLDPMAKNVCFYMTKAKPGSKKRSMDTTVQFDDLNPET